jgi:hypothetical protein
MRKDFANEVGRIHKIERTDLIEKDFILHQILLTSPKTGSFLRTSSLRAEHAS